MKEKRDILFLCQFFLYGNSARLMCGKYDNEELDELSDSVLSVEKVR